MAQLNFDANTVAPNTGVQDPIPDNWYDAQIDESELKPTKDATGTYLQLRFSVMSGDYANRKVYARLNLRNANPVAQEIAYGELSAICHATGVMQLDDSQQLHGIPLKIKVKVREARDGYNATNDITNYKNINENVEQVGGTAQPQASGIPQGFGNQQPQAPTQQPQQPAQAPAQAPQPWEQPQQPQQPQQPPQAPAQQPQQPAQAPQQQGSEQARPWEQQAPQQPAQAPQQPTQAPAQEQPAQQPQPQQPQNGMPPWAQGQG